MRERVFFFFFFKKYIIKRENQSDLDRETGTDVRWKHNEKDKVKEQEHMQLVKQSVGDYEMRKRHRKRDGK